MEIGMKRLAFALAAIASFSTPAAAQTLTVLLPVIRFPDTVVVSPSTKGCAPAPATAVCKLHE